jgi:hypothetical protein
MEQKESLSAEEVARLVREAQDDESRVKIVEDFRRSMPAKGSFSDLMKIAEAPPTEEGKEKVGKALFVGLMMSVRA